jgi:hypothetical protein
VEAPMSRRWIVASALVLVAAAAIGLAPVVHAYLKLGAYAGNRLVGIEWTRQPIRYYITDRNVSGVTATQLANAVSRGFQEWGRPADVVLSSQFVGYTGAEPFVDDTLSVIGFQSRSDLDRTLGATTFQIDSATGAIVESDIFLNSTFDWSVASNGDATRFDVESIIVHELGHFLGLGHSALGETQPRAGGGRTVLAKRAVMFPIAYPRGNIDDRTIEADDIAGITDIYGSGSVQSQRGAIAGRVTLNGAGVYGAHVTAFNPATGDLVGGFSLNAQGDFVIGALSPGLYVVRVEPLDDADIDGFFDEDAPVNLNFRVTYFGQQVAVPAGGTSGSIEIKVRAK